MSYYLSKNLAMPFAEAVDLVTHKLAGKGFAVLTRIDVQETMRAKLGEEFRPYVVLGACNAHFAWRALQAEDKIGALLPCNVIVTELAAGQVEIAVADPVIAMGVIANPKLAAVAQGVRELLQEAIREL